MNNFHRQLINKEFNKGIYHDASCMEVNPGGGGRNRRKQGNREKKQETNTESHASSTGDEESVRLNSAALRRIDQHFSKLHGTASQVAVYRYSPASLNWEKTDTVGCFFLYERCVAPKNGLVVMNRKNSNNFIHAFGDNGSIQLQMPYLLLRSGEDIHCFWFYDKQECLTFLRMFQLIGVTYDERQTQNANMGQTSTGTMMMTQNVNVQQTSKAVTKVMTVEELEAQMFDSGESNDLAKGNLSSNCDMNQLSCRNSGVPFSPPVPAQPDPSFLQQLLNLSLIKTPNNTDSRPQIATTSASASTSGCVEVSRSSLAQNLGRKYQMRTVEQLEKHMDENAGPRAAKQNSNGFMQAQLKQTLGLLKA